jgi:hypothetical protein
MTDEAKKSNKVKGIVGAAGAVVTIVSVWWFALRPRRKAKSESSEA